MNEKDIQSRRRVNLKQTAKGDLYYDLTIELYNDTNENTVEELKKLKEEVETQIISPGRGE